MALDEIHKELYRQHRDYVRDRHADKQHSRLAAAHHKAVFQYLQKAHAEHNGDRQKERELRGDLSRAADEHRAQYRRTRTRGAGDYRKHLKHSDEQCRLAGHSLHVVDDRGFRMVLKNDKRYAVDYQSRRNDLPVFKPLHDRVKQKTYDRGGQAGDQHLEPHLPGVGLFLFGLARGERVKLAEIERYHREYRAKLYNIQIQVRGREARVVYKLVDEYHMAGGAYRQPLGYTLDYAQDDRLKDFQKVQLCVPPKK